MSSLGCCAPTVSSPRADAVVDEVRLLRLLRSAADDVAVLRSEAGADASRTADPMWLRGVKYSFVTAIEACVDAGQHVCAAQGWGPPQDNGQVMNVLAEHSVLDAELARGMRQAVGFRNVLVHDYVDVDDDIVLARLADLADLDSFIAALARLVE